MAETTTRGLPDQDQRRGKYSMLGWAAHYREGTPGRFRPRNGSVASTRRSARITQCMQHKQVARFCQRSLAAKYGRGK